jgi:hypothetical protein
VDNEGGKLKGNCFSVDSGSPYAYGILDNGSDVRVHFDEVEISSKNNDIKFDCIC